MLKSLNDEISEDNRLLINRDFPDSVNSEINSETSRFWRYNVENSKLLTASRCYRVIELLYPIIFRFLNTLNSLEQHVNTEYSLDIVEKRSQLDNDKQLEPVLSAYFERILNNMAELSLI